MRIVFSYFIAWADFIAGITTTNKKVIETIKRYS